MHSWARELAKTEDVTVVTSGGANTKDYEVHLADINIESSYLTRVIAKVSAIKLIQLDANDAERGIKEMLSRKEKIMGFGHRVYKRGDSRAMLMKKYAKELAEQSGKSKYFEIADRIEKVVREQKGLFPNVDFYAALAYFLLGIPIPLYTPIFVLSRTSGWSAHIIEQYSDNRLIRPRAIYNGPGQRPYIQL